MSKKPITIYILDDEFPKIKEFIEQGIYNSAISADNLYHLAITENKWQGEQPLQQLIKDIISSKPFVEGMIKLLGFTKPPQALEFIDEGNQPDLIIYDWEYDMPKPLESQQWLLEIFSKTTSFVFVYSKVRNELPAFLNKNIFDIYANRFQLFLKGSTESYIYSSEEFILQYILSRVSSNYTIKMQGVEINFSANGYLNDPTDILYLEKILGRTFLFDKLKDLDFSINQENVERLLDEYNGKVLYDDEKNVLITPDSKLLIDRFNPKHELTYLEVLQKYDLTTLKNVLETGYCKP